ALEAVVRFHESALKRKIREGAGWSEVTKELLGKLQAVRFDELRTLKEAKDWQAALKLVVTLSDAYKGQNDVQESLAHELAEIAEQPLASNDYREAGRRLGVAENLFRNSTAVEAVRVRLRKRAEDLKSQAEELQRNGDTKEAFARLKTAQEIYPDLPGLSDVMNQLNKSIPMKLVVGVRDLPQNLSPALAVTDSEKQAVELLFEGLVKITPVNDPATNQASMRISLGLAAEMPAQIPLGRLFQIAPNARWCDGSPVTGSDVRKTVQLLCGSNWPGRD